jgi:hypothetical protein
LRPTYATTGNTVLMSPTCKHLATQSVAGQSSGIATKPNMDLRQSQPSQPSRITLACRSSQALPRAVKTLQCPYHGPRARACVDEIYESRAKPSLNRFTHRATKSANISSLATHCASPPESPSSTSVTTSAFLPSYRLETSDARTRIPSFLFYHCISRVRFPVC